MLYWCIFSPIQIVPNEICEYLERWSCVWCFFLGQLKSNSSQLMDEAIIALKNLARQCSDPSTVELLGKHLFAILGGELLLLWGQGFTAFFPVDLIALIYYGWWDRAMCSYSLNISSIVHLTTLGAAHWPWVDPGDRTSENGLWCIYLYSACCFCRLYTLTWMDLSHIVFNSGFSINIGGCPGASSEA